MCVYAHVICCACCVKLACFSLRDVGWHDGARKLSIRPFCRGLHGERLSQASSLESGEDRAH